MMVVFTTWTPAKTMARAVSASMHPLFAGEVALTSRSGPCAEGWSKDDIGAEYYRRSHPSLQWVASISAEGAPGLQCIEAALKAKSNRRGKIPAPVELGPRGTP